MVLFHQPVAGLQVVTPASEAAPSQLSGGYLRSTVHRMVRPPEEQAEQARLGLRLSLIYSARPQADVKLRPVESPLLKRMGLQRESESRDVDGVTAEGELSMFSREC